MESESRPELESVGADRFACSRSRSWSRLFPVSNRAIDPVFQAIFSSVGDAVSLRNAVQLLRNYSTEITYSIQNETGNMVVM